MKKIAIILAASLWAYIIMQACQIQEQDDQAFNRLTIEQELKLNAERFAAIDTIAQQIILDTLQNIQAVQNGEIVLDDIDITLPKPLIEKKGLVK